MNLNLHCSVLTVLYLMDSYCVALSSSAWGFVGEGSNVAPRSSYNTNSPKVIVSRSHSGKVKNFVQAAFGNNTEILPAGGAGTAFWEIISC